MATCSYQALARYDDDCSRKYRARNLDDIRVTQREALARARIQLKCLIMVQNRQSLADVLFADDEDDFYLAGYDEPDTGAALTANSSSNDAWPTSESDTFSPWPTTTEADSCSPWPANTEADSCSSSWPANETDHYQSAWSPPSPSISHHHHHHHQVTSLSDLPDSFLVDTRSSPQQNRNHPKQRHSAMYKQAGAPSPSASPKLICDSDKTKREFENLMNLLKQCPPTAQNISHLIMNSWQILLAAIQDPNTGEAAINFLKTVSNRNLLTPESLVNLIQHGLNYNLCNAIYTQTDGAALICDLLVTLISTEPAVIPYLVESMMTSKLSTELIERISVGSDTETHAVINFYYKLTETIISHKDNPPQPLMPQVLMVTGVSQHTLDSYKPNSTLQKYLTPQLIKSLVTRCLNRTYSREATDLNLTLELLANVIKLAYSSESEEYVVKTLRCLRSLRIEEKMQSLIKGLQRLARQAEFSEHRSQGVSLDQASESVQICTQFLQFYEQYYNYLAQGYSEQLMACETGLVAAV